MIAIAAFVLGVLVGCSSWLFAAAWLETCRRPRAKGRARRLRRFARLGAAPAQRAM